MANLKTKLFIGLLLLACAVFITCSWDNPILEKWWVEPAPESVEQDYIYVPITRYIPEVRYETIIQHETVYETIIEKLPPEVVYETIYETFYIELPPEIIYEVIKEVVIEYETITEYETIYETVIELEVITEYVEVEIERQPTEEEIIQYILDNPAKIIKLIKETEILYETLKELIIQELTKEDIIKIIQSIPPSEIIKYLTEEQIKYIIQQQPAQSILQSIQIIDIEYIIFAGGARIYNGDPVPITGTALTAATKSTNTSIINASLAILEGNDNNLVLLHGHANPVDNTPEEINDLKELSLDRANAVAKEFSDRAKVDLTGRMQTKGFGGEGNIAVSSTSNADLNRRVEVILFRIDTTTIGP